jgi:hypothetical protein
MVAMLLLMLPLVVAAGPHQAAAVSFADTPATRDSVPHGGLEVRAGGLPWCFAVYGYGASVPTMGLTTAPRSRGPGREKW